MLRRILTLALALLLIVGPLTGCGGDSGGGEEGDGDAPLADGDFEYPALYFQLANSNPAVDTNPMHIAVDTFCKKVEEMTGGKVIIEEIPDAQLGNERDYLEGVKMGTIELCLISNSMMTNYNDTNIFAELPFIFRDTDEVFTFLDSDLWRDMLADEVTPELDIIPLGWYYGGFRNILNTKRPITEPEDMNGLKIRGQENRVVVAMYQALNANCTPMPVSEVVTAVQQGTVDGCDFPIGTMVSYGYQEFVEHLALTEHLFYSFAICCSTDVWDDLTPEVQDVLVRAAREAEQEQRQAIMELEEEQMEMIQEMMSVSQVDKDAFADMMEPVYEEFRDMIGGDFFDQALAILGR